MPDADSTDDVVIARYIDELALADAIQQNLYDADDITPEQQRANIQSGHIIDRYIRNSPLPHREGGLPGRPGSRGPAADSPSRSCDQPERADSGSFVQNRHDADLTWLDDPQTLYLRKKLHVHDSVTFVHNLAQMLSSSCVRDALKKVKMVRELKLSADRAKYPVFAIDCDGKIIAWNRAMEELTLRPAAEMIGRGDFAYAVPFYGTPRPMLVDFLLLPPPETGTGSGSRPEGRGGVLTGRAETVWICGRPATIRGRGTRIYDEEGTLIGAVQSIGVGGSPEEDAGGKAEKTEPVSVPDTSEPELSPGQTSSAEPVVLPVSPAREKSGVVLPDGIIRDLESRGLFLHRQHEDLRSALGQLIEQEDRLVKNIGALPRIFRSRGDERPHAPPADELFRQVIMDAREGIIAYDRDLTCILWNTFMERLTGIPASGVIGTRAFEMVPALRDAGAGLLLEQAFSGKTVESPDIPFLLPASGKQAWVRLILSVLSGSDGNANGIIGIIQETTARKVMEYALQTTILQLMESEEKYRSIFNAKNDPLILINTRDRCILDLNDAAAELYGYRRDEFFALSPAQLFTEFDKYQDLLERQTSGIYTYRQRKRDGTVFPADLAAAFFTLKSIPVLLLSVRDLSSAYQTADALRLANTKLNLLIGVTRHDVINNLTVLMGYNDLLKHTVTDKKILEMLGKEEAALHAVHRQIEFTREYYNLGVKSPVWQNICETATRAYSQFITTIPFSCETRDLEIYADPLLEKVFYNLIDNSIRHGARVTRIHVHAVREGPDLLLIFSDDGRGILRENKDRIFLRGYGTHTGLGLFLTREILAITRIEISETGEFEKGVQFELRIPAGLYRFPEAGNPLGASFPERMDQHV